MTRMRRITADLIWIGAAVIRRIRVIRVPIWGIVPQKKLLHPLTEKPTDLAARAMEYSSKPGENVLDLFGGSGSTLIAAEQTGRKAFLMELDPLCRLSGVPRSTRPIHLRNGQAAAGWDSGC